MLNGEDEHALLFELLHEKEVRPPMSEMLHGEDEHSLGSEMLMVI